MENSTESMSGAMASPNMELQPLNPLIIAPFIISLRASRSFRLYMLWAVFQRQSCGNQCRPGCQACTPCRYVCLYRLTDDIHSGVRRDLRRHTCNHNRIEYGDIRHDFGSTRPSLRLSFVSVSTITHEASEPVPLVVGMVINLAFPGD